MQVDHFPPVAIPRTSNLLGSTLLNSYHLTLVLGSASLGKLESNTTASKLAVDLGVGIESVVDAATLLLIKDNLEELAAVLLGAETLANDLDRVDKIGQDGIVDSSESSRTRSLLGLGVARAGGSLGSG